MYDAPNLITVKRSTNTVRNTMFLFLVVGLVGWYGVRFVDESKNIVPAVAQVDGNTQGGDITITFEEHTITEPIKVSTSTYDMTNFSAKSILLKDVATGKSLVTYNEYDIRPIASITKLMSAIVLLDMQVSLTGTTVAASGNVYDSFLIAGLEYERDDLWNAALIGSSNRAILSLVDESGVSREEFIQRMNQKARELGMSDTTFTDPTGLDDKNVSSASDILILLKEALDRKEIYIALSRTEYNLATIAGEHDTRVRNTNWLLLRWIPHTFAKLHPGKTGFIPASGYNFTTRIEDEEGNEVDVVVLGANAHENRFSEARDITSWVFTNYDWQTRTVRTPK